MTLRLARDPYGDENMSRAEGRLSWAVSKRGVFYAAAGRWETGQEPELVCPR